MSALWDAIRQGAGNLIDSAGTAIGLPETGISEKVAGGATTNTNFGGLGMSQASGGQSPAPNMSVDTRLPMSSATNPNAQDYQPSSSPAPSGGGGAPAGVDLSNPAKKTAYAHSKGYDNYEQLIAAGQGDQQGAAERAAEARRKAAESRYGAAVKIGESAKGMAKESYDWLIDTIGSNKKDLLGQVATQETQGLADYQLQQDKTTSGYDKAKQDILSTYRDLQTQQEKIIRGSGMSSSSRSQEATLRLNNLLGKDISTVSTNEADSIAMIGNALTKFKDSIRQTNVGIETESTQKLDKAALDYKQQIQNIDNNLTLSANEKEEAYANAEAQLAADSQSISQWATGLKLEAAQFQATQQGNLDNFVADMLDENGMLNAGLDQKRSAADSILSGAGNTSLSTNPTVNTPTGGVFQKANQTYASKEALDAALQAGEITSTDYQQQLQKMQSGGNQTLAVATPTQGVVNPRGTSAQRDPLFSALSA